MSFNRDSAGRIVVPGTSKITRTWRASEGVAPSFMPLSTALSGDTGAALTFGGANTLRPYADLTPAAAANGLAGLVGPAIDLNDVTFLRLSLFGVRFSHPTGIGLAMGAYDRGTNAFGGRANIPAGTNNGANAPFATLASFPVNSSNNPPPGDSPYVARFGNEYQKIRDIGFIMLPRSRHLFLMEGDQAAVAWKHPRLDLGSVVPVVQAAMPTTGTIAARYVRLEGLELEIGFR